MGLESLDLNVLVDMYNIKFDDRPTLIGLSIDKAKQVVAQALRDEKPYKPDVPDDAYI